MLQVQHHTHHCLLSIRWNLGNTIIVIEWICYTCVCKREHYFYRLRKRLSDMKDRSVGQSHNCSHMWSVTYASHRRYGWLTKLLIEYNSQLAEYNITFILFAHDCEEMLFKVSDIWRKFGCRERQGELSIICIIELMLWRQLSYESAETEWSKLQDKLTMTENRPSRYAIEKLTRRWVAVINSDKKVRLCT